MQIPILIEPMANGNYRANAGEPFNLRAYGNTEDEAARQLVNLIHERLRGGARLGVIDVGGEANAETPAVIRLEPLPADDWFFQTMEEAKTENRRREDAECRSNEQHDDQTKEKSAVFIPNIHYANRMKVPEEELEPFRGKQVAWNFEGTRIVAAADDGDELRDELEKKGIDKQTVVFSYLEKSNEIYMGGAMWEFIDEKTETP